MKKVISPQLESEITVYIKNRKDKKKAIQFASEMFLVPQKDIEDILFKSGLIDNDGQYIEPPKYSWEDNKNGEKNMPKKPDTLVMTKKRIAKLTLMYQDDLPVSEIAKVLKCTEEQVYDAIGRFNIVRTKYVKPEPVKSPVTKAAPVPEVQEQKKHVEAVESEQQADNDTYCTHCTEEKNNTNMFTVGSAGVGEAVMHLGWAGESVSMLDLVVSQFESGEDIKAFVTIGKMYGLLGEASRSKSSL